jgi:ABC-type antimicrobial peptide transport system permease subunit
VYALPPNFFPGVPPQFVVRGEPSALDVAARASAVVGDLLPPRTAYRTLPWLDRFDRNVKTRRFIAGMFLALSFASLGLAVAGLFGVLSYTVTQRKREFATRIALGARSAHLVRLVLHDGFVMALGGTALGATVAMWAAFVLWKWLWGVYPIDAQALLVSEGILLGVTVLAAILPALRATRADPVEVMRAT